MSSAAVAEAFRDRLAAEWPAGRYPIREANTDFDPGGRPFAELAFPSAEYSRGAIGDNASPLWRETGAVMCHVFVPQGHGDAGLRSLADTLAAIFLRWPDPPEGLTIYRRLPGSTGGRTVQGRPWHGVSFGITYVYETVG